MPYKIIAIWICAIIIVASSWGVILHYNSLQGQAASKEVAVQTLREVAGQVVNLEFDKLKIPYFEQRSKKKHTKRQTVTEEGLLEVLIDSLKEEQSLYSLETVGYKANVLNNLNKFPLEQIVREWQKKIRERDRGVVCSLLLSINPLEQNRVHEIFMGDTTICTSQNEISLNGKLVHRLLANVTSQYYPSCSVRVTLSEQSPDTIVYLATYNRGQFKAVAQSEVKSGNALFPVVPCGLLYFQVAAKDNELCPVGNPFIATSDSVHFITPVRRTISLNGLSLYDVKRVLKLGTKPYTLLYWEEGWKPLKTAVSTDSCTLNFGEVPVQSLYLVYGYIGMERMQRPFLIEQGGKPVYY